MAIPDRFLDDLTQRCDIVDVISRYVALKKQGSGYVGLCPFHSEKTPSFHLLGGQTGLGCTLAVLL